MHNMTSMWNRKLLSSTYWVKKLLRHTSQDVFLNCIACNSARRLRPCTSDCWYTLLFAPIPNNIRSCPRMAADFRSRAAQLVAQLPVQLTLQQAVPVAAEEAVQLAIKLAVRLAGQAAVQPAARLLSRLAAQPVQRDGSLLAQAVLQAAVQGAHRASQGFVHLAAPLEDTTRILGCQMSSSLHNWWHNWLHNLQPPWPMYSSRHSLQHN
jgi:hypothetical protein